MQSAILFGLTAAASSITQQVSTVYPSGNGLWEQYLSLGMCSSYSDVSDKITTKRGDFGLPSHRIGPERTVAVFQPSLPNTSYRTVRALATQMFLAKDGSGL